MIEVREVLRGWLGGAGLRTVAAQAGVDRKTARRYVQAAEAVGVVREGGWVQVTDEVVGAVVAAVRPARPEGHGGAWQLLEGQRQQITAWVDQGLTVVKIRALLERRGVVVPYRTLHRFCVQCCGFGRGSETCGWSTESRGRSARSTSARWACFTTWPQTGAVPCTR